MFNEIDGNFNDVAIRTFKVGLLAEHYLRKSLTRKPTRSIRQVMDRTDEYKWVERDQQQGKGKAKLIPRDQMDFRSDRYNNNRSRRDFYGHTRVATTQVVIVVFRKPIHQILERIRMNHISNGQIRWDENPQSAIKVFIVNTTRTEDTLQKSVGLYVIT